MLLKAKEQRGSGSVRPAPRAEKGDAGRGMRSRAGRPRATLPALREARWAELLRRIFEVEPLECPRCGQTRRIVAFITEPKVIDRILDHLSRTATARRRSRAPPARARMVRAAAGSGSA